MSTPDVVSSGQPRLELDRFLKRVRRRWLAATILRNLALDGIVGASVLALVVAADRAFYPGLVSWSFTGFWAGAWVAASLLRSLCWGRIGRVDAAVLADARLALKERMASVEHLQRHGHQDLAEVSGLLEADAARAINDAAVAAKFPVSVPRFAAWIVVPAAACVALALWLPAFDFFNHGGRKEAFAREEKGVEEVKKKLDEKYSELVRKAEEKRLPDAQKVLELLAQKLDEQPARLDKTDGGERKEGEKANAEPRKDALVQMTRREDAIKKGLEDEKLKPLKAGLEELKSLDLKNAQLTKKLQQALKDGDLNKAKDALGELKDDFNKLAQKSPDQLTPEEKARMEKLSRELANLARDSKAMAKLSRALSQASQALGKDGNSSKDMQDGLESLEAAASELESLASLADQMEMLDQALELVKLSKEELAKLASCPECGTPYCADCGKPQCGCKPSQKPCSGQASAGGT